MSSSGNTVFVVIALHGLTDEIRENIDKGDFQAAMDLSYKCKAITDKLLSFVQEKGGHLHVLLADRQVLEVPSSLAESLPSILDGYSKDLPGMIAVGLGLNFKEASLAMKMSMVTDEIEMYDPEDPKFSGQSVNKTESPLELPVNLFDVSVPKPEEKQPKALFTLRPDINQESKMTSALLQAIAETMSPPQSMQPQPQEYQPRNLMEALEGRQLPDQQPQQQSEQQQPEQKAVPEESSSEEPEQDQEQKIDKLLSSVKSHLPQIMAMHDSNPEAYKSAIALIQKLVSVSKQAKVKKAEAVTDDINKALRLKLPVGTRKGNKKKVIVDGKEVWRSMAAGQVMDPEGRAVSVKSSNKEAKEAFSGK